MKYWLIKSEPFKYSWSDLEKDKLTYWDGVRNYAARLNLRAMGKGDLCLFYHSNEGLEIVGVAEVVKTAYQDPTTDDDRWVAVDVREHKKLDRPVSLKEIKADEKLGNMELVRQSRLSVSKVSEAEYKRIITLSTK
jgi:predicted RNA-binding protein with PUA-like domain